MNECKRGGLLDSCHVKIMNKPHVTNSLLLLLAKFSVFLDMLLASKANLEILTFYSFKLVA